MLCRCSGWILEPVMLFWIPYYTCALRPAKQSTCDGRGLNVVTK